MFLEGAVFLEGAGFSEGAGFLEGAVRVDLQCFGSEYAWDEFFSLVEW